MKNLFAIIAAAFLTLVQSRSSLVSLQSLHTEFNSDIISSANLSLIKVADDNVINGSLITKIELQQFDLTVTLRSPGVNGHLITAFNTTVGGCDFITRKYRRSASPWAAFVVNSIRKSMTNFPPKCPVRKDTELLISNLYIDTQSLPFYVPQGCFQCMLLATRRSMLILKILVDGVTGINSKKIG